MNKNLIKLIYYLKSPRKVIRPLGQRGFFNWLPDKTYLKLVYRSETGEKLNLHNPQTFNEKLQWLKLYDRKPEYTNYVDKFAVREYVKEKIGEEYLIPIIGVFDKVEEINWDVLPEKFVLKCTHGSGANIICENKNELNVKHAEEKLKKWLNESWFWFGREWVYKNVKPRIVCEKYMVDESGTELKDYKIFCFNGEPKLIEVDFNRYTNHKRNLYTTEWEYMDAKIKYPNDSSVNIPRPANLNKMLQLARLLAENIPHVRIDFYSIDNEIYFGEMTFSHGSGFENFEPEQLNKKMGEWIKLPKQKHF